ncbi:uncharacterized protein METZ01_LOCUS52695 [marine metagenome]|uniref:Methionine biosynthesis protein MetW n=1 Tax=marine metagenome TaxID=408172 RepID=A0A381S957_9ZZZZ
MKTETVIESWVRDGSSILDLGCGDGSILEALRSNKSVQGYGIEIDRKNIKSCLEKNLEVIEQNIDEGLSNFLDKSFDTVLVSQTIQVLKNPKQALEEITRIGHQSIIVIPNFGHWKSRLTLFLEGKMPVTESLPEKWYETPNIHLCTLTDFENLCAELNIVIEEKKILDSKGTVSTLFSTWSNLLGSSVIYRLSR